MPPKEELSSTFNCFKKTVAKLYVAIYYCKWSCILINCYCCYFYCCCFYYCYFLLLLFFLLSIKTKVFLKRSCLSKANVCQLITHHYSLRLNICPFFQIIFFWCFIYSYSSFCDNLFAVVSVWFFGGNGNIVSLWHFLFLNVCSLQTKL